MTPAARSPQPAARSLKPAARSLKPKTGFTLVELLSTIAIMAILVTAAVVYIPNYVTWAKNTADKQTLAVLNDALTRYKCQGGDVNKLTLGAPIGNILTRLKTPVTWGGAGGISHQFLQSAFTYPARSLIAVGNNTQYRFNTAGSYSAEALSFSAPTSQQPYGVGARVTLHAASKFYVWLSGSATATAGLAADGAIYYGVNNAQTHYGEWDNPSYSSIMVWPCAANGDPTRSGTLTSFGEGYDNNINTVDVRGLPEVQIILFQNGGITALDVTGCTEITNINISNSPNITSITGISSCVKLGQGGWPALDINGSGIESSPAALASLIANLPAASVTATILVTNASYTTNTLPTNWQYATAE